MVILQSLEMHGHLEKPDFNQVMFGGELTTGFLRKLYPNPCTVGMCSLRRVITYLMTMVLLVTIHSFSCSSPMAVVVIVVIVMGFWRQIRCLCIRLENIQELVAWSGP